VSSDTASGDQPAGPTPVSGRRPICWFPSPGADPSITSKGRAWVRQALRKLLPAPPGEALAYNLELVTSELITNGVVHGGGVTRVCLQLHGLRVRLSVRDRVADEPAVASDAFGTSHEHGRGMAIIEAVAAGWGVDRDVSGDRTGKTVWLDLAIH
jgi:anti-sigma regulatory factor (Ser/Thr protein kinase)